MKIQKIGSFVPKINFGAGVTKLYSDFDGTYIPKKYNHDSVCNYSPQVNREDFKSSMDNTWQLFGDLKGGGTESKFNFTITTGRNIAETNYFLNKLRSQDLWVPLPEKLITCNGQDEFILNVKDENDFFKSDKPAFVKTNVNKEKRKIYQDKGWNYQEIVSKVKELFSKEKQYNVNVYFKDKEQPISKAVAEHLGLNEEETFPILKEIEAKKLDASATRKFLEERSKHHPEEQHEKDVYNWYMGQLADVVYQETNRQHFILENIPTTRSNGEYQDDLSLQTALEKRGSSKDDDYIAFSDDGELGIRIAISEKYKNNIDYFKNDPKLVELINNKGASISKINKGSFAGREIEIKPNSIDKFEDTKIEVDNVIKNKTNDLIIVSGDGANDAKMLTISEYIRPTSEVFIPSSDDEIEQFKNIPLVAIYVDNRSDKEREDKDSEISKMLEKNKYCNYDGRLRFIHVDPKDSNKPQTLDQAIKMAVASYAKTNDEFKKNLSTEMQKSLEGYKYTYPQDNKLTEEFEEKLNPENSKKSFIQEEFIKFQNSCDEILKISTAGEIEGCALDENYNMPINDREKIVFALAGMLTSFKAIEKKWGKEYTTQQLQLHINNLIKTTPGPKNEKIKLMERLFIDRNILKTPENPQEFINKIKKQINIKPSKWEMLVNWTKEFARTKTGKFTIGATILAAIVGGITLARNKETTNNITSRERH